MKKTPELVTPGDEKSKIRDQTSSFSLTNKEFLAQTEKWDELLKKIEDSHAVDKDNAEQLKDQLVTNDWEPEVEKIEKHFDTVTKVSQALEHILESNKKLWPDIKSMIRENIALINQDNNINEKDSFGYNILTLLLSDPIYKDILAIVLQDANVDVNNNGGNPLMIAASNKNLEAFKLLLQRADINVNIKDRSENNVFYWIDGWPSSKYGSLTEIVRTMKYRSIRKEMKKLIRNHPNYKKETK